jgi:hypothetical protein
MASILGPHMLAYPNARRDHFKLFADLFPDAAHLLPAGAAFLFFADIVNGLDPRSLRRQRFTSAFASTMSTNLYGLLIRLLAALSKEDLLRLVEQKKLTTVFLAELLRSTTKDLPSQKLNLFEMFQRFELVLDLLGAFLFQVGLELTNTILQFLYTFW